MNRNIRDLIEDLEETESNYGGFVRNKAKDHDKDKDPKKKKGKLHQPKDTADR